MKGVLLSHILLEGPKQMALDRLLLEQCIAQSDVSITVRFYSWKGTWLSIGKNQKVIPQRWHNLVAKNKIKIVRRPSGGEAVLHSGGLTYSLIWKAPPRKKREAYYQASQWLINGFKEMGISLSFGLEKTNPISGNCFATATAADLIDETGSKRIGSAQYWQAGHLLQHGEILLNPPIELWKALFQKDPPNLIPLKASNKEIEEFLTKALFSYWPGVNWNEQIINEKTFSTLININDFSL